METKVNNKRIAVTAVLSVAAIFIVLIAVFLSGRNPGPEILGIALVMVLGIIFIAAAKSVRKKKVLYAGLFTGIVMIIAGSGLAMIPDLKSISGGFSAMAIMGIIMTAICAVSLRRPPDYDIRDERSLKVGTWAISYSWYLAYLAVILMFWLSFFKIASLTAESVLGIMMFLMPLSAVAFQWYFSRRGDVY